MEIISLDKNNIESEHICCAISDAKSREGVEKKKQLMTELFGAGYRFHKLDARGKVFIDYMPAETSWLPVKADGYMLLNCFWVSGQYKGSGWGRQLFNRCETDAAGMKGIIAVSSVKKQPFMSEPGFLKKNGFEVVDEAAPYFCLWCRKNDPDAETPVFFESAKSVTGGNPEGLTVYYSEFCPFTTYWNETVLPEYAESLGVPLTLRKIRSREDGLSMPVPWIMNAVFYNGEFLTQEIKINRFLEKKLQLSGH